MNMDKSMEPNAESDILLLITKQSVGFEVRSYLFVPVEELAIISSDEVFPNRTIVQCAKE